MKQFFNEKCAGQMFHVKQFLAKKCPNKMFHVKHFDVSLVSENKVGAAAIFVLVFLTKRVKYDKI